MEVRSKLLEHGIAIRITAPTAADGIGVDRESKRLALSPIDDATAVIDITFVDDEPVAICAAVPSTLCKHVDFAIETIVATFSKFNFTVNFAKGKTELMVKFRGKDARACKERLVDRDNMKWSLSSKVYGRTGSRALHVVDTYRHVGSVVDISGSLVLEARARVGAAMNSFAPIASKIYGSPRINVARKLTLAWALVFSRLFFNVHVWSKFEGKPRQVLQTMYMRVLRRIRGQPRFAAGGSTDLTIRRELGALSVDCIARRARLKYIGRLARSGAHIVLNLVAQVVDGNNKRLPWMELLALDFDILRLELPRTFVDCPRFQDDPQFFYTIFRDCPGEWKLIVDAYQSPLNDVENPLLRDAGAASQEDGRLTTSAVFECDQCAPGTAVFCSSKALQAHSRKKHGVRAAVIRYIPDTTVCPICQVEFRSRLRLITHASESRIRSKTRRIGCRDQILNGNFPPVPNDELTKLNLRDRDTRRAASRAGHSHEIARAPAKRPHGVPHILSKRASGALYSPAVQPILRRIRTKRKAPEFDTAVQPITAAKRRRICC